jgi:predicted nucleic acid-binding Zn finger protein
MKNEEIKIEKPKPTRVEDGAWIALNGRIIKVHDQNAWWVSSQSKPNEHYIVKADGTCNCPDFVYRGITCKHIWSVTIKHSVVQVKVEVGA